MVRVASLVCGDLPRPHDDGPPDSGTGVGGVYRLLCRDDATLRLSHHLG